MARINIYDIGEYTGEKTLAGWFDPNTAERFEEGRYWDGNNHRGVISNLQIGGEWLYRTKGGRWVRHYDSSSEFNGPEFYEFVADDAARTWLLRADEDEAVEKYFGELDLENGPGRPEVGPATNVRLGEELTAKVDTARREGESRAAAIRRLLTEALAPTHTLTIVDGEQPNASGVDFGEAAIDVDDDVYAWMTQHGVDSEDEPDRWVLVTPASEQPNAVNVVASREITA